MNEIEQAKITYKECAKLREFVKSLDLPLSEKHNFMYRISSIEEDSIKSITKGILKDELENLKKLE